MNDMTPNPRAVIGGNNPPDPIETALAPFGDAIEEAQNWLDGTPVETEAQMQAVDALSKEVKAARKAVMEAEEGEAKPLYDAWKAVKARYKPAVDDLDRIVKGLAATVDTFKKRLAAEKAEAQRKAREEMEAKRRAAEEAARAAAAADIEAQRAAARAQMEAEEAARRAAEASRDTVKGLRTVTRYEITDERAALFWIAEHDREALAGFVADYVRRHHKTAAIAGVRVWQDKEAF